MGQIWIYKFFCIYVAHEIVITCCTPLLLLLNHVFSPKFTWFHTIKSLSVTQRSDSQENSYKKGKNLLPFCCTIGSKNSAAWITDKNFSVFKKIAKFELNVTVHCALWAKCIQLWPHDEIVSFFIEKWLN